MSRSYSSQFVVDSVLAVLSNSMNLLDAIIFGTGRYRDCLLDSVLLRMGWLSHYFYYTLYNTEHSSAMATTTRLCLTFITILSIFVLHSAVAQQTHPHQKPPSHYLPNYLQVGDPLHIVLRVWNSTYENLISSSYSMLYSLQQPALTTDIQVPLFEGMDNLTITAELWAESNTAKPIAVTHQNLTRFAKERTGSGLVGMEMGLQGIPDEKHHANSNETKSKYCMHVPVRFSILLLFTEYWLPFEKNFFRTLGIIISNKQNNKYFVLPLDLSQLHVPYKTYKPLHYLLYHNRTVKDTDNPSNVSQMNDIYHSQGEIRHRVQVTIQPYSFTYYQFFFGFTNRDYLIKNNPLMAEFYTEDTIDLIKETLFDNNFYLVVVYFTLSMVQTFMQIFAFKNEIQVWKNVENRPGLSIKSLYQMLVFELIIVLYLYEKDANRLYMIFHLFDLVLTVWKITRALQISIGSQNRFFISIRYKQWYHNKVESADSEATHYTNYLIIALFIPFMLYKLYPSMKLAYGYHVKQLPIPMPSLHTVYLFVLENAVFFIFIFGFVMMTPQLYLNYKLKSVEHLPWKTLIYRFISTIIDDIFVFMIDIPWLQRMFSFRDDVIFIAYLVQRRIYRVDQNRLALSHGSVDLSKINKSKPIEQGPTQPAMAQEQNHQKLQ